jgi:hypothetical protein
MMLDGVGSGSLAVSRPSRIIACMRSRTARGSVGLYTLLPSPVCGRVFLFNLACVADDWFGSVVLLPARARFTVLPEDGVRGAPTRTA